MKLVHFDGGRHSAAENMTRDLLLLEAYPQPDALRLRHYGWEGSCFTFGYSQQHAWISGQLPRGDHQLIRRPTGGGLVDHRNDWTYAFVIPHAHPFFRERAEEVYRLVHEAIAQAFDAAGRPAALAPKRETTGGVARVQGLCFSGPEPYDVIDPKTGQKFAGAAMKRNRHGLLLQGSADRVAVGEGVDWAKFQTVLIRALCARFGATECEQGVEPGYPAETIKPVVEKFESDAWNQRR